MTREELQSAIQDFWDEAFHCSKHEISDTSKAIALECMMDAAARENPQPLTLEEVKEHITKGHPNDIKPLYVDFKPTIPIDYASRWRDAYNLSRLIEGEAMNTEKHGLLTVQSRRRKTRERL